MLLELGGKQGKLCQPAAEGKLRCPLILRANAEDAVTATVMGVLKVLQPRWVVPDLLNAALGAARFDRRHLPNFRIDLWQNRPMFPVELLGWREGSSQIEVTMRWEGPAPTTAFWEFKYESPLSPKTANGEPPLPPEDLADVGEGEFPDEGQGHSGDEDPSLRRFQGPDAQRGPLDGDGDVRRMTPRCEGLHRGVPTGRPNSVPRHPNRAVSPSPS